MPFKKLDPQHYNLSSRTQLRENPSGEISIVIDRKSRIIMKDGRRILEQAEQIRAIHAQSTISVLTSAPVCSKTRVFLKEHSIDIRELKS